MHNLPDEDTRPLAELMSDDEFVRLMDAEYEKYRRPSREKDKREIWRDMARIIDREKFAGDRQRFAYAIAASLVIMLVPALLMSPATKESHRTKGENVVPEVKLVPYVLAGNGELRMFKPDILAGDTLVFKAEVSRVAYVALLLARNDMPPAVKFDGGPQAPGSELLLENGGDTYGYRLEKDDASLRFCAVAAATTAELETSISTATQHWQKLKACFTWTTRRS